MKASLAMVAQAPLDAIRMVSLCLARQPVTMGDLRTCLRLEGGVRRHCRPFAASQPRRWRSIRRAQVLMLRVSPHCFSCSPAPWDHCRDTPAPTTTLERPLHSDAYPSTREIVAIALPRPLYIAAGVGLTTCIRVYATWSAIAPFLSRAVSFLLTLSRSMGYMTECSCVNTSASAVFLPHHAILPRCLRMRRQPCSPPARSWVVATHS